MATIEELQEELRELEKRKEEIASEYNRTLTSGFEKHKECCPDICSEINNQIGNLKSIRENFIQKKKTATRATYHIINKSIISSEEQMKSLEDLRSKLYAKAICNCNR